jgi:6-pyruvoyl-tetrahydropterin synthase
MIRDFSELEAVVQSALPDHECLNDILGDAEPTAENLALYIADRIRNCITVQVYQNLRYIRVFETDTCGVEAVRGVDFD